MKKRIGVNTIDFITLHEDYRWVEIKKRFVGGDKLWVCCIYRSPANTIENKDNIIYLGQLLVGALSREYSHLLIIYDFNYPQIDWPTSSMPGQGENEESSSWKHLGMVSCSNRC